LGLNWLPAAAQSAVQPAALAAKAAAKLVAAPARELVARRLPAPAIKLDGVLDEAAWQTAPLADHFIEYRPKPGRPERLPTEVRVLYDDAAIYVGAKLMEPSQDSIRRELTQRDYARNTDMFALFLDPYRDHLNGYGFFVLSTGVQMDSRISPAVGEDNSWNAVWESRVAPLPGGRGWSVEMRIPYSAIRFAASPTNSGSGAGSAPPAPQTWGMQFMRQRRATNQQFFWNPVRPEVDGFVNQWGALTGLENLHPPLRLSLTPYVSAYVNHFPYNEQGKKNTTTSFNGGADIKWGINESFTLDATLVPDFGQVISDNQVLNLSPFEVQFQENRPFFTEGTELFNKGNLFYSRRVGAQPMGFYDVAGQLGRGEFVRENPGTTRLLNATKVSGRTRRGLGVGVFNAVAAATYATVQDSVSGRQRQILTQPLTNYNIVVLDQSLPHNSFVSLINTNVTHAGSAYEANVLAGVVKFADAKNRYVFQGQATYSRRRGQLLGSDRPVSDPDGYQYYLNYGKVSGNFTWYVDHGVQSAGYNPNDLGILFGNNNASQSLNAAYNHYDQVWKVNSYSIQASLNHSTLFTPLLYQNVNLYVGGRTTFTKSFLSTGFNLNVNAPDRDFFEPRTFPLGQYWLHNTGSVYLGGYVSSDARKRLAYDLSGWARPSELDERLPGRPRRTYLALSLSPRFRLNDHFNLRYNFEYLLRLNQIGYVNDGFRPDLYPQDALYQAILGPDVLLGRRRVATITNTLTANYTFTNTLSLTFRARHYVSGVRYADFARLRPGGTEELLPGYQRNHDTSFSAFNIDAQAVWWFAPGSQVSLVWKDATSSFLAGNEATPLYFDNLSNTLNTPHNNNVSIRVLYFLDYLNLRHRRG